MNYFEIKVYVPKNSNTEAVENFLVMNEIYNYFVTDPKIEEEMMAEMPWLIKDELLTGPAYITICIEEREEAERVFNLIKAVFDTEIRDAKSSEWQDNWKQFAKIVNITDNLIIKPVWVDYEKKEGEKIIELDSGAAFGTGTHETTKLCAQLLHKHLKSPKYMLDIGTGSGILAIIGGAMGASNIVATDIDPAAVETAKINIEKNGFSDITDVRCGDLLSCVDEKFDVITANIIVDILLILLKDVKKFLNEDGILILSGILEEKSQIIIDAAREAGFELCERLIENDWTALMFERYI